MKSTFLVTAALLAFSPVVHSVAHAQPSVGHCPPGLAKKNPPCVPPGQVGKNYQVGERYGDDGYWDDAYRRQYDLPQLPQGESYYRIGDSFVRVDDDTRLVLELFEVLAGAGN